MLLIDLNNLFCRLKANGNGTKGLKNNSILQLYD